MKITNLLFWAQENQLSAKFYKKIGFKIVHDDDEYSVVSLGGFEITLVNMRDEDQFANDSMSAEKGKGMYVYIKVDSVDSKYHDLTKLGLKPTEPKDWQWGNREFILKDPDGYKLCFWQLITGE